MSYGAAAALQQAVYQKLLADTTLDALVQGAVYDALPQGSLPDIYVTLGPEDVRDAADQSGDGAWHRFTVSVVTNGAGFQAAKEVAGAVSDALSDTTLTLTRGSMTGLHFFRARAARQGTGAVRRIDLTFRARIDDTL